MKGIIVKVLDSILENGIRYIKALRFGAADAVTPKEYSPFGIDSCPLPNMQGYYTETTTNGAPVILGYQTGNKTSEAGQIIVYCTDSNATITAKAQFAEGAIAMRADDQIKITSTNETIVTASEIQLLGDTNHLTQFEALDLKLGLYLTALNSSISAGVGSAGGVYFPPAPLDISSAKTTNIKTV